MTQPTDSNSCELIPYLDLDLDICSHDLMEKIISKNEKITNQISF